MPLEVIGGPWRECQTLLTRFRGWMGGRLCLESYLAVGGSPQFAVR